MSSVHALTFLLACVILDIYEYYKTQYLLKEETMTHKTLTAMGRPFGYRITEDGDLCFFGAMPDYALPSATPWYGERDRIFRVVGEPGSRVGSNAFSAMPALRVAILSEVREVGIRAFASCPRLFSVALSPRTVSVSPSAFSSCPRLLCLDFSGSRLELSRLGLPTDTLLCRTVEPSEGETVAGGEIGGGFWSLTADGTLTVAGASIPDCRFAERHAYHAYAPSIRRVVVWDDVKRIGEKAFSSLPALRSVTVTGPTEISAFAFASCPCLETLELHAPVSEVGVYAFAGGGMRTVMMSPSIRVIPEGLFDSCRHLHTLVLPALPLRAAEDPVTRCGALRALKLPGTEEEYRSASRAARLRLGRVSYLFGETAERDGVEELMKLAGDAGSARDELADAASSEWRALIATLSELASVTEESERSYLRREAHRLGFTDEGIGGELRAAAAIERAASRQSRAFCRALRDAARTASRLASASRTVHRHASRAMGAAEDRYPYALGAKHACEELAAGPLGASALPTEDEYRTAATEASQLAPLFAMYRFGEIRDVLKRISGLIGGTLETPPPESPLPPLRILVAGGDPAVDPATAACMEAVRRAGGVPVIAARGETDLGYDGLILCDGGSVDPLRYDERRRTTPVNEQRDLRDATLFDAFFLYGKPILGIARGCSFLNVRLGGSLRRNLSPSQLALHCGEKGRAVHPIILSPESYLYKIYTPTVRPVRVLSRHTDALRELGRELYAVARSEDGLTEAIAHRRLPVYGVQFSPEEMLPAAVHTLPLTSPDDGTPLFSWFLRRCAEIREHPLTPSAAQRFSKL